MDRLTLQVVAAHKPFAFIVLSHAHNKLSDLPLCARCAAMGDWPWPEHMRFGKWKWWWSIGLLYAFYGPICQSCCHCFEKEDMWTGSP